MEKDNDMFESLIGWSQSNGAKLHPSVEIYRDEETGVSLRAKSSTQTPIQPGESIVTCPRGITLSYLNALSTPPDGFRPTSGVPFPEEFLRETEPHVVGRFVLIKEFLSGPSSFWWPYIRTLPQPAQLSSWILPAMWASDDIEMLEGTNLQVAIEEIKTRTKREFKEARKRLEGWDNWRDYTKILYDWSYCMFTSRSFVPSLVVPEVDRISLPTGCKINDFGILLPLFDIGNHSITASISWVASSETQSCELITGDTYAAGMQIFNNYGSKTNGQLLLAYGFIIPESKSVHNDYIHIRLRASESGDVEKRQEYFFSRHPIRETRSVLGQKLVRSVPDPRPVLAAFSHIDENLLWALLLELVPAGADDAEDVVAKRFQEFIRGTVPPALKPVLYQTIGIIQHKALQELEKLDETEFELGEGEPTKFQTQALEYRRSCRAVLISILESIEGTDDI